MHVDVQVVVWETACRGRNPKTRSQGMGDSLECSSETR